VPCFLFGVGIIHLYEYLADDYRLIPTTRRSIQLSLALEAGVMALWRGDREAGALLLRTGRGGW
jgi:hypothetical protein